MGGASSIERMWFDDLAPGWKWSALGYAYFVCRCGGIRIVELTQELGLKKRITPRALRRTFNDLARAAQVTDVITRSISGHLTEGMQRHYSTVSGEEQRQALAKSSTWPKCGLLSVQGG